MNLYKPTFTSFETDEQMIKAACDLCVNHLLEVFGDYGSARVALSGGKTPLPLYVKLFAHPMIDLDKIEVYQTDERFVSPENDQSNQKNFLEAIGESASYLHNYYPISIFETPEKTAEKYNEVINSLDEPEFDLCVLGIGEDGHFASLFPNGKYLSNDIDNVIQTKATGNNPILERISLSPKPILQSQIILILLSGETKKHIVPEILSGKKSALEFPAKFLLQNPNVYIFESFE